MRNNKILTLHWKLFIPLVGLMWLIIGITIVYFVSHEKQRQRENLENRLLNVNNTVIDAYERGEDLKSTVGFIQLFTDNTTLAPLHITVYDNEGRMVADNPAATIPVYDSNGKINPEYRPLLNESAMAVIQDMGFIDKRGMISYSVSPDGKIYSFAALPYEGEVVSFLSYDPMVWVTIIILGLIVSVLAYFGVRAVCRNVYALKDFAEAIASDKLPDNIETWRFSKDELGEVSKLLLTLYSDKIHAQQDKIRHERQIGMNVSHELKTPVGIIKGYLDTILESDEMPDELKHKFLVRAKENTDRLTSLINDLSMVMHLQQKGRLSDLSIIDFKAFITQLAEDVVQANITDNIAFEYNIPADCRVIVHESLLTNALLNLINNSVKHSGCTRISLDCIGQSDGYYRFVFTDNGIGVSPEHLGRLFELFYRVDTGRSRKKGGMGLGLPLVNRIISAMGGTISVDNADQGGLRFTFTLPKA